MTRKIKAAALLCVLTVIGLAAVSCSQTRTYASQCAYLIQSGFLDARHIDKLLHPGEQSGSNNDTSRYIYCNARNYLVRPDGDQKTPLTGRTENNSDSTPGNPVNVFISMYWQLNQNDTILKKFLPFCEKYNCFSSADTSGSARYSSPGWNGMLHETFQPSLERATVLALQKYHGTLPNDQAMWPQLGKDIAKNFMDQVRVSDGSGTDDFFCSSGSKYNGDDLHSGYDCQPVQITVDTVEYQNADAAKLFAQATTLDAQRQNAQKQAAVNRALLDAARQKYGPFASYFLGLQDTIQKCHDAGQQCTVVLGGNNVTVPTK